MENLLKKAIWIIGFMIIIFMGLIALYSENSTKVIPKEDVEVVSQKMITALNANAWASIQDTMIWQRDNVITKWHKATDKVIIQVSSDMFIEMNGRGENGKVMTNGQVINDSTTLAKVIERWEEEFFCLFAAYSIHDKDIHRSLAPMEKGHIGLLIQQKDASRYLWSLDKSFLPESAKLLDQTTNPKILQSASWQDWKTMENGMKIALKYVLNGKEIAITNFDIKKR